MIKYVKAVAIISIFLILPNCSKKGDRAFDSKSGQSLLLDSYHQLAQSLILRNTSDFMNLIDTSYQDEGVTKDGLKDTIIKYFANYDSLVANIPFILVNDLSSDQALVHHEINIYGIDNKGDTILTDTSAGSARWILKAGLWKLYGDQKDSVAAQVKVRPRAQDSLLDEISEDAAIGLGIIDMVMAAAFWDTSTKGWGDGDTTGWPEITYLISKDSLSFVDTIEIDFKNGIIGSDGIGKSGKIRVYKDKGNSTGSVTLRLKYENFKIAKRTVKNVTASAQEKITLTGTVKDSMIAQIELSMTISGDFGTSKVTLNGISLIKTNLAHSINDDKITFYTKSDRSSLVSVNNSNYEFTISQTNRFRYSRFHIFPDSGLITFKVQGLVLGDIAYKDLLDTLNDNWLDSLGKVYSESVDVYFNDRERHRNALTGIVGFLDDNYDILEKDIERKRDAKSFEIKVDFDGTNLNNNIAPKVILSYDGKMVIKRDFKSYLLE